MKTLIKFLVSKRLPLVLMGDFNLPGIVWDPVVSAPSTHNQIDFLNIFIKNGLKQIVTEPTREKAILDLVLVNDPSLVHYVKVDSPLQNCDHSTLCFDVNVSPLAVPASVYRQNWNLVNAAGMEEELTAINWDIFFRNCTTPNEMWIALVLEMWF